MSSAGVIYKVPLDETLQILSWLQELKPRSRESRGQSTLDGLGMMLPERSPIQAPSGGRAFEVVAIPPPAPEGGAG